MLPLALDPMRYFPADPGTRRVAADLFGCISGLPIISPHGHVDAAWFASDTPFSDPVSLLVWPDHYVLRMLYSQGVRLSALGLAGAEPPETDRRAIWRLFARNYRLFRGTPSQLWLDYVFADVFGLDRRLDEDTADYVFDAVCAALKTAEFRPRALFERFRIEVLATTEGALDDLGHHQAIRASGWAKRIISTFRPDDVADPERADFGENLRRLAELTGEDVGDWRGYLAALRARRAFFRKAGGATASDHGPPSALTADLSATQCQGLLDQALGPGLGAEDAEVFRGQMLVEMAQMACDDGMVMQLHPGSWRNHNPHLLQAYGRDRGADIPKRISYVDALKPLLDRFGDRADLTLILFTLDESNYARELAPLVGHYPCLRLGPPWWFHDSPEGMLRHRRQTIETAGFYNTVGFNDDTRAFLSIPARHDLARRMDCSFLAELVVTGRLSRDDAEAVVVDLTYALPKAAYRL